MRRQGLVAVATARIAMTDANNVPGSQAEWADPTLLPTTRAWSSTPLQLGFVVAATSNAVSLVCQQDRDPQFLPSRPG